MSATKGRMNKLSGDEGGKVLVWYVVCVWAYIMQGDYIHWYLSHSAVCCVIVLLKKLYYSIHSVYVFTEAFLNFIYFFSYSGITIVLLPLNNFPEFH